MTDCTHLCTFADQPGEPATQALRDGVLQVPRRYSDGRRLDAGAGLRWSELAELPPTAKWWLNGFKWVRGLLATGAAADTALARRHLLDWAEQNPRGAPATDRAWDGHAVALRSEALACLRGRSSDDPAVEETARAHGAFLADPEHYQGNWNHGLDQNIGLLMLGAAAGREDWTALARSRTLDALAAMVDWQGVTNEQAVGYQYYNHVRIEDARRAFARCGAPLPETAFDRVDAMPAFLAHATRPDGTWERLGDSIAEPAQPIAGTPAEWSATGGRSGSRPSGRFAVYHGGYAFGRSGWGTERPFDRESFHSIRFGPGRRIHGHNDHMSITWHALGTPILVDGGFAGYADPEMRAHLQSPQAHNVALAADGSRFGWNERTRLVDLEVERDWQSYGLTDRPHHETRRRRDVLVVDRPFPALMIKDRIAAPRGRAYEQLIHFDPGFAAGLPGERTVLQRPGVRVTAMQLWPFDAIRVARGERDPFRGWCAVGHDRAEPCPVLITGRSGRVATYLTLLIPTEGEAEIAVTQRPVRTSEVSRQVRIAVDGASLSVDVHEDGRLRAVAP